MIYYKIMSSKSFEKLINLGRGLSPSSLLGQFTMIGPYYWLEPIKTGLQLLVVTLDLSRVK